MKIELECIHCHELREVEIGDSMEKDVWECQQEQGWEYTDSVSKAGLLFWTRQVICPQCAEQYNKIKRACYSVSYWICVAIAVLAFIFMVSVDTEDQRWLFNIVICFFSFGAAFIFAKYLRKGMK